ncbi:MAG: GH3 auxin-responsive promoter family protein [Deltaproteobacteria bacterium]|nr:GH3 auxin-responsive promoter family protein [Deltaproteobacteria bacterium]
MSFLKASLLLREWLHYSRFQQATQQPEVAQREFLRTLIKRNSETAFGREHGFSAIANPGDYARRVPIRDYEGFRPYVNRIVTGERDVLTAEMPFMFTTTSGTTGEPKYIPVTTAWREQMASLMRLWMFYALQDHANLLKRKVFTIVSPAVEGRTAGGIPFGAMSGVTYQRIPWIVRRQYAIPYGVSLIHDHDARYFVTMRLALAQAVSVIGTPNPTSLIRLAETANRHTEDLIRAIYDGTLGIPRPQTMPEADDSHGEVMRAIEAQLRPDRERAQVLGKIVAEHGVLSLPHCWPDLAVVACWLGGNAGIHARRLADYYGPGVALRDLGFLASEGRMTVPVEDHDAAGVLAVHANFYEFIPEDGIDNPQPSVLLAHELEEGKRYYIVLSGGNGLYRYDLNDIVEVRGFYRRTPKIAFVRKGRDMVSITGEKLHLNQIQAAIREAEQRSHLEVWQFRLIPAVEESRYDLLVELRGESDSPLHGDVFLEAFDQTLSALNIEYASKRASQRLGPLRLFLMRSGWSERMCQADFHGGKREIQYKWPAIGVAWDEASRAEVLCCFDRQKRDVRTRVNGGERLSHQPVRTLPGMGPSDTQHH